MKLRTVDSLFRSRPVVEGAGVRLRRAFGHGQAPQFDPFLMLDHFGSDNPEDYLAGFPWHPHRGIETVTYVLSGRVAHGDSIGNSGAIGPGDLQWMTAGSGIIHQEMPQDTPDRLNGFQLWLNLPRAQKMMPPRYRDVAAATVPEAEPAPGVRVKVIAGVVGDVSGPVRDLVVETEYLDIALQPGSRFDHPVPGDRRVFAYVFEGTAECGGQVVEHGTAALLGDGDAVRLAAGDAPARLLLVSGRPLDEPVAWGGPIVMNTQAELDLAFRELERGTFIKHGRTPS
jgi:redox-sensitive bicupin YhaK (pirin superfamily)